MGMSSSNPRFYLISGSSEGWPGVAEPDSQRLPTAAGDAVGLRITANPMGSLGLSCRDGSLGKLVLPRGIAIDRDLLVYLLDSRRGNVLRFDPFASANQPFRALPEVGNSNHGALNEPASAPRRFSRPCGIAIDDENLYVADTGNRRVQVFALQSLALRAIWPFRVRPRDVAVFRGNVYVLTADHICRYRWGEDRPTPFATRSKGSPGTWKRLAVDKNGWLYALRGSTKVSPAVLDVFDQHGATKTPVDDAAEVRDRYAFPAVFSVPEEDSQKPLAFILPEPLMRPCGRALPVPMTGLPPEAMFANCPPLCSTTDEEDPKGCSGPKESTSSSKQGLVFDTHGMRVRIPECRMPATPLLRPSGIWFADGIDSGIYHCQWHRIVLNLPVLPPGCRVLIETYADDLPHLAIEIQFLPEQAWDKAIEITGHAIDPQQRLKDPHGEVDGLVSSAPGRYLWLKVTLFGDGFTTPVIESLQLSYPRQSYLEYLPAIFSEEEQGRRFLERFLSIFQTEWDQLEKRVAEFAAYLDPGALPDKGGFLEYLASWLGITFETTWTPDQRRRLLKAIPALTFAPRQGGLPGNNRRATLSGLRDFINVYLQNLIGEDTAKQFSFPVLVEGFRERDFALLADGASAGVEGPGEQRSRPLWGAERVRRFQVDEHAQLDQDRLLSAGEPNLDVFGFYAHRFRVFAPAAWVRDAAGERALRRAIDAEKPAHTTYALQLVGARFRVGVQSTIGIDTILGAVSKTHLTRAEDDPLLAPSRPPTGCLGYDTVLAPINEPAPMRIGHGATLGFHSLRL